MSNIVPFNQSAAPAYIGQVGMTAEQIKAMNAAAAIGTGGAGVDRISIKASRFRLVIGGVAQPPLPVVELDVAILRVNDGINKVFYEADWNPDADAGPPDCSSDDGVTPRADSPKKQAATCATCPRNEWGSHINPTTGAKGKACQDSKRMAIMAPSMDGRYAEPTNMFQLAVPPASLKDFGMLVKGLAAHNPPAAYNMVVVTLSFDSDASFPKLNFKPKRWLEADEFAVVNGRYNDEETKRICGLAEAQGIVLGGQASAQAAPQQPAQQAIQQQPVVQQTAQQPVQQQPAAQQGWGGQQAQPVVQQPVQQVATGQANGWGGEIAQPIVQQQAQPVAQQGWGGEQAQPVTQQQPVVQQQAAQQAGAPVRERGKPSNGRARRTKEEIAEDAAADARDQAAQAGQQQAQPVQQTAVQQPAQGGWGGERAQPVVQQAQPVTQQGWGGEQAQPVAQTGSQTGWGGQQAQPVQQTGAPNQPNLAQPGDLAFAGWDD
ncbi:hypothetical protein [Pseudomonas mediterranea]|uniref:hypothetical protein n=1 Tax=Pseudomonas mediterranea TaxID=183795 RepID=UPI0006D8BADE|nr:hypothetical protein [Pseudomonas mediterranea]